MNPSIACADIVETAHTKKPTKTYFRLRKGRSIQRGSVKFRRNTLRPARHRYSEMVPTGHNQLQKALRKRNATETKVISRNMAAGCIAGTRPVSRKYLKFIMPAMGSQPSTPAGRFNEVLKLPVSN